MNKLYFIFLFTTTSLLATSQTVDFTYININGSNGFCSPSTINFTPITTGTLVGLTWYFGNGQTSNSAIPSVTYSTGTYVVKLVAVFQNVALEISKTIVVNPSITASLSASAVYICKLDSIRFTCNTNAATPSFFFNFGDGSTPVTTTNSSYTHNYTAFGTYTAGVRVTSVNGCVDTASIVVEVKRVPITDTIYPTRGCVPITTNLAVDVSTPPGSSVTNYAWNFDDGTAVSNTTSNNTTHVYTDSGTYTPTLLVTTVEGCTNTITFQNIAFGIPPTLTSASSDKLQYCVKENGLFTATSNFANAYKWEWGDGASEFVTDTLATHGYFTIGPKIVKVTPIFNGCPGTPITLNINVVGVLANFFYANTCANKKRFTFTNFSLGTQNIYTWNFGDGSPTTSITNPIHTYPPVGTFFTKLLVVDGLSSCRDSLTIPIYTANPILVNNDTFICKKATTIFTVLNNYANPSVVNTWSTLGNTILGVPAQNSITITANQYGNFNTHLVSINNGSSYCKDTASISKLISVRGPLASYTTNTTACTNNNYIINNTSVPYLPTDNIVNTNWNFGFGNLTSTAFQPPGFIFPQEGTYTIQLVIKDVKGCSDTLSNSVLVKESPFLRIFPRAATICAGTPVTLTAYYTDTLLWMPANLVACTTCDTTVAIVNTTSTVYAMASNANGCSLKDSTTITVFEPFTATANPNTFFACKNETVNIKTITPANKKLIWSPTVGLNNSAIYIPTATIFTDTITYTALLTDSLNCYSSSVKVLVKQHPPASVSAGPNRILSYNSPFIISPAYSSDVNKYEWSPAGNLNCTTCPNPSGFAETLQTFVIKASNAQNCVSRDTITIAVECASANLYMASAFNPNSTINKKYYYPQTRGIKTLNKFTIYNRYGQIIFNVQNALPNIRALGWDGTYKGIVQNPDGYVYTLDATCELGEKLSKKGAFLLLR